MLDTLFEGIFSSTTILLPQFAACVVTALLIGAFLAFIYTRRGRYTASFLVTLALLPAIVCVVILLVNGNIGAGVAVAGAFSLVRFRSQPGTARDICSLFLAMGAGLACGMGYLGYAVLFALALGGLMLALERVAARLPRKQDGERLLRVTIPEDLDYSQIFDDLFETYTKRWETVSVKTANMGSLYKLSYEVTLKDPKQEKEFLDALRCRNGNLELSLSRMEDSHEL
ncbi:MAG: DUF4956 domain-containing protein [Oscillospiraceae bacterium]|nr:DUF4956 domain-containing protein [Oscillospiraceae bacterium]